MCAEGALSPVLASTAFTCAVVRPKLSNDQRSSTSVYPMARMARKVPSGSAFILSRTE